ncbi:uncharacterized protein LOC62_03G004783 [Vanrija pseudolonga]|uniref:VOC domain-containing protein n=1 Tax=Vanrija pseudolonga TaxID=143232 RepID=A0AAF1BLT1_9TREE|nr:hypothetical protein LOC62_03G004783 [Vanrija pseudolonga]
MIDHVYISVANLTRSAAFYKQFLASLGWREFGLHKSTAAGVPDLHGFLEAAYGNGQIGCSIWLRQRQAGETGLYIGLVADSPEEVNAAADAAVAAGATLESPTGNRDHFGPGYYAANVVDFDGNRIEIGDRNPPPPTRPHTINACNI